MSDLEPALTAEEWEAVEQNSAGTLTGGYSLDYTVLVTTHPGGRGAIVGVEDRHKDLEAHGAAAALLYGQPFGFTREDVQFLRDVHCEHSACFQASNSLADRIESLLPPEK